MDIQQFIRDLLAGGEATAEEASRRRQGRLSEPLPYPGKLMKGMTVDPLVAAGKMAGGDVPDYLEEDLARTVYPGWMGGEPELEVFPKGTLNPAMPEGAADIAMNAPTSGLIGGMARGTVDRNLLGVNAPHDPQADQYEQMIKEMNEAFDDMYPPEPNQLDDAAWDAWATAGYPEDQLPPLSTLGPEPTPNPPPAPTPAAPAAAPHPLLSGIPKVQAAAAATPVPAAPAPASDLDKVKAWIAGGNYKSNFNPSGALTQFEQDVLADSALQELFAKEILKNPNVWHKELADAGVGKQTGYTGDAAKDAMIDLGVANGWNKDKLVEHYKKFPIGQVDDITFNKAPEVHIAPEWKAGYQPAAPKVAAAAGTPEGEYDKMVAHFVGSGASASQAEALAKQTLKKYIGGGVPNPKWASMGVNIPKAKQWGVQLQASTPPPGQQSPFQYAGNKQGGTVPPPKPAPLAAPSFYTPLPPKPLSFTHGGPYWKEAMNWIYQEDIKGVEGLVGKAMNYRHPDIQQAAGEELARILGDPSQWLPKLQHRQNIPHAINMPAQEAAGIDWRKNVPTTFQGGTLQRARAHAGGFNPDEMFYRTTRYPMRRFFDPSSKSRSQWGFSGKQLPHVTSYGIFLYPHHLSLGPNVVEKDFAGRGISPQFDRWLKEGTDDLSVTGMIARNIDDIGGVQDQWMWRSPSQTRSTYAEFDPKRFHEGDLMAGYAGGINPFAGGEEQSYDTKLDPIGENMFQAWKQQNAPKDSGYDYDLRGAFQSGLQPDPQTGHWPDQFKKPNHPTFSDQSQYAAQGASGHWFGDAYAPADPFPWLPTGQQPAQAPGPLQININEWERERYLPNRSGRARPPF